MNSSFDPQVEFLEVGVNINGAQNWRVNGVDLNGVFGGLNGTGGLEAVISPDGTTGTINDVFGNVVAAIGSNNTVTWSPTKVGSYGPLPQYAARTLENGASFIEVSTWRTRRADPTGLINLGARHYDKESGSFISADPLGHATSWSLYDFAAGDGVNSFDADGRVATQYGNWMYNGGVLGDALRGATSLLESASNYGVNNNNVTIASASAFASSITGSLSAMASPSTYVDSVTNLGSNINTVYSERGIIDASSYALTSWNVGAIASGTLNVDLVTGAPVGDFFERATVVSGGVAATAGVTASVAAPVVSILSTPKPPPLPIGTFKEVPTNYITISAAKGSSESGSLNDGPSHTLRYSGNDFGKTWRGRCFRHSSRRHRRDECRSNC
ncbi:MAG: hypothetical protein Fur0032_05580 [Terrimicrobiaceae bacterium]